MVAGLGQPDGGEARGGWALWFSGGVLGAMVLPPLVSPPAPLAHGLALQPPCCTGPAVSFTIDYSTSICIMLVIY